MSARHIRARLAAETRHRPDEDHTELRRAYKAEALAEHITRVVDGAPPLTAAQRARLAAILTPSGGGTVGATA